MGFDRSTTEQEIHNWFFVEYFDRWVAKGAGESDEDPSFISNYWDSPMFVSAPPLIRAWLTAPEHVELFRDEVTAYADRLREAGVPVEFHDVPGAPHAFDALVPGAGVSQAFLGSAVGFLAKQLAKS